MLNNLRILLTFVFLIIMESAVIEFKGNPLCLSVVQYHLWLQSGVFCNLLSQWLEGGCSLFILQYFYEHVPSVIIHCVWMAGESVGFISLHRVFQKHLWSCFTVETQVHSLSNNMWNSYSSFYACCWRYNYCIMC